MIPRSWQQPGRGAVSTLAVAGMFLPLLVRSVTKLTAVSVVPGQLDRWTGALQLHRRKDVENMTFIPRPDRWGTAGTTEKKTDIMDVFISTLL